MAVKAREGRTDNNSGADREPPVGVVLSGAAARGAYEAGVLSVLLPKLGPEPKVFVGTSAGALNAALFASLAHLPPEEAAAQVLDVWRGIHTSMVMRPVWATLPVAAVQYFAGLMGLPGRLSGLLDYGPLMRTLQEERLMDWRQLHQNISAGKVKTFAVVTTEVDTGRTKVFCESSQPRDIPASDDDRAIDYVSTREINYVHVAASAAIPVMFRPIRIGTRRAASWHMDGGVRLNAPLKPAIALGARSLVVISTDPGQYKAAVDYPSVRAVPTVEDVVDQVAHAVLGDRMIEDLRTLDKTNSFLRDDVHITSPGGRKYERMPYLFGGPDSANTIADRAAEALSEALHGVRALRYPDLTLLNFLLGLSPDARSDLISYVFYEPEFIQRMITLGQEDAQRLLSPTGLNWRLESNRVDGDRSAPPGSQEVPARRPARGAPAARA